MNISHPLWRLPSVELLCSSVHSSDMIAVTHDIKKGLSLAALDKVVGAGWPKKVSGNCSKGSVGGSYP